MDDPTSTLLHLIDKECAGHSLEDSSDVFVYLFLEQDVLNALIWREWKGNERLLLFQQLPVIRRSVMALNTL
jgi:hypothetical protein